MKIRVGMVEFASAGQMTAETLETVHDELNRILASALFQRSPRHRDLLKWVIDRAINGREPAKEHEIGMGALGRPESWDPRIDPIVRVEFRRLRERLSQFYETAGPSAPIRIELPARGYAPVFSRSDEPASSAPQPPPPAAPVEVRNSPWRLFLARRFIVIGFAVVFVASGAGVGFRYFQGRRNAAGSVSRIAVLPFQDLSLDPADRGLADGFTDQLTTDLASLPGLRVAARTSSSQFRDKNLDVRQVGSLLGVGAVVEGSIQRAGKRTRIQAQLNRASDGMHLWADTFDSDGLDVLRVQQEVAMAVASTLRLRIRAVERLAAARVALPPETQDAWLHALAEGEKLTPESMDTALLLMNQVIGKAPDFAAAWQGRAQIHLSRANQGVVNPREERELARKDIQRAIQLNPGLPDARTVLAFLEYTMDWNWDRAEADFRASLQGADTAYAHQYYGWALLTRGQVPESEEQFRQSRERDPLWVGARITYAETLIMASKFDAAAEEIAAAKRLQPRWWKVPLFEAFVNVYRNNPGEAFAEIEEANKLRPNPSSTNIAYAVACAETGRREEAIRTLARLEEQPPGVRPEFYFMAVAWGILGDTGKLFDWLEKSASDREYEILYVKMDPQLRRWQSDARMVGLEKRLGLTSQ